jgi:hypothetical protein
MVIAIRMPIDVDTSATHEVLKTESFFSEPTVRAKFEAYGFVGSTQRRNHFVANVA